MAIVFKGLQRNLECVGGVLLQNSLQLAELRVDRFEFPLTDIAVKVALERRLGF